MDLLTGVMDVLGRAAVYAQAHTSELGEAVAEHLWLVAVSLGIAILTCVPLGILTARSRFVALGVINAINAVRVIPSLAILFLLIPYLGLNTASAAVALTVLALPPVLINTDAGFRTISPAVREAARGMGFTATQLLLWIELPLAAPVILTGIRIAAVEVIGSATLAAFVGSGGLGIYVTRGFALYDPAILLVGAVPVALLTLFAEASIGTFQKKYRY